MGVRRQARERAVQALYQLDSVGALEVAAAAEPLRTFWQSLDPQEPEIQAMAAPLIDGVLARLADLDRAVEEVSANWKLARMATVDRNVLRLGAYELLHRAEVPPKVVINEAIEIARTYGSQESGAFINGILDRIATKVTH
jgi:transcription antitermination protein NusB